MFFIEIPKIRKRPSVVLSHFLPALIIFSSIMVITLWAWNSARQRTREDVNNILNIHAQDSSSELQEQMRAYEEILRAGSGLFMASEQVSPSEWQNYVKIFDLQQRYRGILGLGFAQISYPDTLNQHISDIQAFDPNYTITPPGQRERYVSTIYYDPPNPMVRIGFDHYTDPARAKAIDHAEKTGQVGITSLVYAVNDTEKKHPGFIMYFPVYNTGAHDSSSPNRTDAIAGFIFAPFQSSTFFKSLQDADGDLFGYTVRTTNSGLSQDLYKSPNFDDINNEKNKHTIQKVIDVYNQKWTIDYVAKPYIGTPEVRQKPATILVAGTAFALIISMSVYVLLSTRAKVAVYDEEAKLQLAKDELLALASHQLRTPATGVKQYVGMVRDGFVGSVTKQQKDLLNKAYESNERQLKTVSQMLSVARIDTDRLHLEPIDTNISEMLNDVIAEQKKTIDEKKQKITKRIAKNVHAEIDRHNFRMVLENVINNASKYTPDKGQIWVTLTDAGDSLNITVRDSGVGILEDELPLLFKKFVRIPNKLTRKVSGSGLGLYLAKNIVESHAGEITLEAHAEKGSVASIIIPKKQP